MSKALVGSLVLSVCLLSAGLSYADSPGWVHNTTIQYVTVQPNGRIYVRLNSAVPDLNCTGNTFGYLEFDTTAPYFKEQYSLIMAAHMAGRTMSVYVGGCGHYPQIQNTRVY